MPEIIIPTGHRIRGLSVKQPWAELLVRGLKTIELRTWWPWLQLPQWVAIHAGKTVAGDAPDRVFEMAFGLAPNEVWQQCVLKQIGGRGVRVWIGRHGPVMQRTGGLIGLARFVRRYDFGAGRLQFEDLAKEHLCPLHWWHKEMTGFEFDSPMRFELTPCRGQLGFFKLDAEMEARVREVAR